MIVSFIITFRESLEAALIVGIVLSYLVKTKQTAYFKVIFIAIASAIVSSIVGAILFFSIAGGFTGIAEKSFEGITMLIGAALLTTMILWMMKQSHIARKLEEKVATQIAEAHKFGLFFLVFISILREGIETVIFLASASFISTDNNLIGALIGISVAILLGYIIFVGSKKINLKKFFTITNVFLILFAAGLVAHGLHELQEANIIPIIIEHVWDINPPVNPDGSFPLFHENGYIGSILKGLFGYNGNPSLIEVLSYLIYISVVILLWVKIDKNIKNKVDLKR